MRKRKLSIVVPVYDEEDTVNTVLGKILAVKISWEKEVIVVNDCSRDQTGTKVKEFMRTHPGVVYLEHSVNLGKGAAVKSGILKSSGDYLLIQDADLEYNPEDYPILLEPVEKSNADVVYGSRLVTNRPHRVLYFWHYLGNIVLTTYSNMLTNLNISDMETGYKLFRGSLIREIARGLQSKRFGFEPEVTAKIGHRPGLRIYEVGISYTGRTYSEGKKISWKDGVRALWEITKYNLWSR